MTELLEARRGMRERSGRCCGRLLLREIAIGGQRLYFDTNTSNHNHFFVESEGKLVDIPSGEVNVVGLPEPPEHFKISHIDVVVRLIAK
jgi:Fur family transcriptional regulator, iron response regulator